MLKSKKVFTLIAVLLLTVFLVGCGGNVVQNFLNENAAELEETIAPMRAMMGEGGDIRVEAGRNNEMIYIFTYGSDADTAGVDDILAMQSGMFEMLAQGLREELELDSFTITVRFLDSDGTELASQSFEA